MPELVHHHDGTTAPTWPRALLVALRAPRTTWARLLALGGAVAAVVLLALVVPIGASSVDGDLGRSLDPLGVRAPDLPMCRLPK